MTNTENSYTDTFTARLGANHGYRIQGELACLNAELAIARDADALARQWAVQLWACDAPYGGGTLSGTKVAEAALDVVADSQAQPQQLYAEMLAHLPSSGRDYSMVLVLASGQAGTFDRVHDFANYPVRERFSAPYLEGNVGYAIEGDSVLINAARVCNPRAAENSLSSLALELWALHEPYAGEQFAGVPLAGVQLGSLPGQQSFEYIERRLAFAPPPAGQSWNVTLMLREWTADGYVTRDYRNFAAPLIWDVQAPEVAPAKPVEVAQPVEVAKPLAAAKPAVVAPAAAAPKPVAATDVVASAKPPVALAEASAKLAAAAAATSKLAAAATATVPPVLAKTEAPAAKRLEAPAAPRAKTSALVSIQTASLEELTLVKGLNKKLAAEIIKARPFRSLEELTRVRGIGDNLLRRLRSELTL
jgi:DNA uptake protein ComE-like DNA-binding protein